MKYKAIYNLLRRKNSKETILRALYDLIKSKYSIKILISLFNIIIKRLYKSNNKKRKSVQNHEINSLIDSSNNKNNNSDLFSFELLNPKVYLD